VAEENIAHQALGEQAAFQLANVTKTAPQYGAITPRWLVRLLDWKPLEAGTFRRNRVDESKPIDVTCGQVDESALPETYVQYEENPKEHKLSAINAVFSEEAINIAAEYLQTDAKVGYVVIDVETDERAGTAEIRRKLERVPGTIRTRVLY